MSAWTDRMQFCMQGASDYFGSFPRPDGGVQGGPQLQGGLVAPNGYASGGHGLSQGLIAAMNLPGIVALGPGSPSGATRWGTIQSIVPWAWMYAAVGHSEPNSQLEVRRLTAMVLTRSTNRWNFVFRGARPSWYTGWNSTVNLLGSVAAEYAQPFFNGYQETLGSGNTAAYRPWQNIGIETWAYPSSESPGIVPFSGAINPALVQDSDGFLCAFQVRVIPVNPSLPINRANARFIAQMGYDFQGNTNGMYPWDYAHASRNFIEGNNGRWVTVNPDGSWQWIICVASGNLVPGNNGYRPPFAAAAGVADYSGDWPYNGSAYGGRGWTELTTTTVPIDLIAYYSEGGVLPPVDPPPTPGEAYVHPGAATLPVFGAKVVSGYKDFGPKNRASTVAPSWGTPPVFSVVIGGTITGTVTASGTPAPTYTKISGPPWLTVGSSDGALGGTSTDTEEVAYNAVIRATNTAGTADVELLIRVVEGVSITTTSMPGGAVGTAYLALIAVAGTGPFTWSLDSASSASLAAIGLSLGGGSVFGSDPIAGVATFTVRATDPGGAYDEATLTITIGAAGTAPTITTTSLPTGTVGAAYSASIAADGQGPFGWSLKAGSLPPGLTLVPALDYDVALTGAALRAVIGDPAKYHAASRGWIIPGEAAARVNASARSSVAWQLRADGGYEVAPHNLLPGSYAITTANGWSKGSSITEGGASGTLNGWPAYLYTSTAASNSYVNRAISVEVGCTYTVRFWCSHTGAGWVTMGTTNRQVNYTKTLLSAGLYEWTATFTAAATETAATIHVGVIDAANGTAWRVSAPQVCIGSVACAHVPTHDAAVFGPAVDWIAADGGAYEIRSEESRTNNVRNSAAKGAVAGGAFPGDWSFTQGVAGLSATIVGPSTLLGMPAVDIRIQGTHASASYAAINFFGGGITGASNGQVRTLSVYYQRIAGSNAGIDVFAPYYNELTSGGAYITGGRGATTNPTTSVQRASYTRTLSGGGTVAKVDPYVLWDTTAGQAIDITLRIACPQEEIGPSASSPILCHDAATTRGEDLPVIPDTSPSFIGTTGGTMLAEFTPGAPRLVNTFVATLDDGTAVERVVLYRDTARAGQVAVSDGGTTRLTDAATSTTAADGALSRIAGTWSPEVFDASMNGSARVGISGPIALPTVNRFVIGNQSAGGRALGGSVRALYYRSNRTPAANVVALSGGNAPTVGDTLTIVGTPTAAMTQTLLGEAANDVGSDDQLLQLIINPAAPTGTTGGWSRWLTR